MALFYFPSHVLTSCVQRYGTVKQFPANGHSADPIPDFEDDSLRAVPQEQEPQADYEESREEPAESAPAVVNVAVHPPPRELTPAPVRSRSNDEDVDGKLAEATAEINRLRALLAEMPEPSSKSSTVAPTELRRRTRALSTGGTTSIGSETDVSSYVDEPMHPDGVPLQIVIIIALGVFVTTYLFF